MRQNSNKIFSSDAVESMRASLQADLNPAKAKLRGSLLSGVGLGKSKRPLEIGKHNAAGNRPNPAGPTQRGSSDKSSRTAARANVGVSSKVPFALSKGSEEFCNEESRMFFDSSFHSTVLQSVPNDRPIYVRETVGVQ